MTDDIKLPQLPRLRVPLIEAAKLYRLFGDVKKETAMNYEKIRQALAMGPTPGPRKWWEHEDFGYCWVNPRDGGLWIAKCDVRNPFDPEQRANAALIAACDPDTIRQLLAERDALAAEVERLTEALRHNVEVEALPKAQ